MQSFYEALCNFPRCGLLNFPLQHFHELGLDHVVNRIVLVDVIDDFLHQMLVLRKVSLAIELESDAQEDSHHLLSEVYFVGADQLVDIVPGNKFSEKAKCNLINLGRYVDSAVMFETR